MADHNKRDPPPPYGMNMPQPQASSPTYPPYPPYPPHPTTQQPTTTSATTVINLRPQAAPVNFGPKSQHCVCPHCYASISTQVKSEVAAKTHLVSLLLWLACCQCCCLCLCCPYCTDCCKAQNHYCPNCKAFLGTYDQ